MENSMIPWRVSEFSLVEHPWNHWPNQIAAPTKFVADIVDHEHQVVPRPSEKNVALRRHPNANQKKEKLRR